MIKTLGYLAKFRDWRLLIAAGVAGFCVTLAVMEAAVAASVPLDGASILLAAVAGALFGIFLAFVWAALRVVR
jgi:hypothetical protein